MAKLLSVFCLLSCLLMSANHAWCAEGWRCWLGAAVVEDMSAQLNSTGRIDPVLLTESLGYVEECHGTVILAFKRFASNEQELHSSWLRELEGVASGNRADTDLCQFLLAARKTADREPETSLRLYLAGLPSCTSEQVVPLSESLRFENLSLATLRHFPHCDGAGCSFTSDFLLFLLGTHPNAFFRAMHADQADATKWLSQLPDLSFAGDPSDKVRRESIRKELLEQISLSRAPGFLREKSQCENTLSRIRFRAWN